MLRSRKSFPPTADEWDHGFVEMKYPFDLIVSFRNLNKHIVQGTSVLNCVSVNLRSSGQYGQGEEIVRKMWESCSEHTDRKSSNAPFPKSNQQKNRWLKRQV